MSETIPFTLIEQEVVGYVLLAVLSKETQARITAISRQLDDALPGVLWCMPAAALHITLCEIYLPQDYGQDTTELFEVHRQQYEAATQAILAGQRKIMVNFTTMEASPGAIIVRGEDDGSFNVLRSRLVKELPLPAETKLPPAIIHSSIARYTQAVGLDRVRQETARHQIDWHEEVTSFQLVRCDLQPLLRYQVLQSYLLH